MIEIIQAIAMLCAINSANPIPTKRAQIDCQKYFISCMKRKNGDNKSGTWDIQNLISCIEER